MGHALDGARSGRPPAPRPYGPRVLGWTSVLGGERKSGLREVFDQARTGPEKRKAAPAGCGHRLFSLQMELTTSCCQA